MVTAALLEQQLHVLLVLLLLQGELAIHLQALPLHGHLQPAHQLLLLLQLHLQLREGDVLPVLLLPQRHHLPGPRSEEQLSAYRAWEACLAPLRLIELVVWYSV